MQKKNRWILIAVIIIIIVAVGGYAIFHKSSNTTPSTSSTAQTNVAPVNNAVVITKTSSSLGQYLTDPSSRTLYTYNADTNGVSNCTGSCLSTWPAYQDTGSTSNLPAGIGTIKRSDNGQTQYTYNSKPLYYFVGDSQGQVTGNGVQNFQVAKPSATTSSQSTSPSSSSSSNNNSSSSNPY